MIQSMTGYGRGEGTCGGYTFKVEIRSVNHRYCDITVKLPDELRRLEQRIRSAISNKFSRGKFEISISPVGAPVKDVRPLLNFPAIAQSQAIIDELSKIFNTHLDIRKEIGLSDILALQNFVTFPGADYHHPEIDEPLMKIVNQSLEELMEMRLREGRVLCRDLKSRIHRIESMTKRIERHVPAVIRDMKKRYIERIKELSDIPQINMDRVNQEIAIMIERMDITEEIVRLGSHIGQLKDKLSDGAVIGRSLDFLLQEVNREINTIASKALDVKISQIVVDMKSEVERIREQVQNIE